MLNSGLVMVNSVNLNTNQGRNGRNHNTLKTLMLKIVNQILDQSLNNGEFLEGV